MNPTTCAGWLQKFLSDEAFAANVEARFWTKVDRSSGECWIWTACKPSTGWYGRFGFGKNGTMSAHKAAYVIANRKLPTGYVCHRCDNPLCVRPEHLYDGTPSDNVRDMNERGRANRPVWRGEAHPRARYTAEQARAVRRLTAEGHQRGYIVQALGVSKQFVDKVRRGRAWVTA